MKSFRFVLVPVAIVLLLLLSIPALIVRVLVCLRAASWQQVWQHLNASNFAQAILIDLWGNVLCQDLFNWLLITPDGYRFGRPFDTISMVLAVNQRLNCLTAMGKRLVLLIDYIDPGHTDRTYQQYTTFTYPTK